MRDGRPNRVGQVWLSSVSGMIRLVIDVPSDLTPSYHMAMAFALDGSLTRYDIYEPEEGFEALSSYYERLS